MKFSAGVMLGRVPLFANRTYSELFLSDIFIFFRFVDLKQSLGAFFADRNPKIGHRADWGNRSPAQRCRSWRARAAPCPSATRPPKTPPGAALGPSRSGFCRPLGPNRRRDALEGLLNSADEGTYILVAHLEFRA